MTPSLQFFDEKGNPLAGGTVHLFEQSQWGTRVMAVSYATFQCEDAPGCVNPNPVILDSQGRACIYLRPGYYEIEVRDAAGRLLPGYPQTVVTPNPSNDLQTERRGGTVDPAPHHSARRDQPK